MNINDTEFLKGRIVGIILTLMCLGVIATFMDTEFSNKQQLQLIQFAEKINK